MSALKANQQHKGLIRGSLVSNTNKLIRHQSQNNETPIKELAQGIMTYNNYFARIMGLNDRDYKEKLDRYFFIGLQEQMQMSFDLLASTINKPQVILPVSNVTVQSGNNGPGALSANEINLFKKENQLDYLIYDYVKARLDRLQA